MKKKISFLALMLVAACLFAQKNTNPSKSLNFTNLKEVQNMSQFARDSMINDLKKNQKPPVFKRNGKDVSTQISSNAQQITTEMTNLLVQVLENPDSKMVTRSQEKMDALMYKMDVSMDELDYKIDKQEIKHKFRNRNYHSTSQKHEARQNMHEGLRRLKQQRRNDKKELKEERKEERRDTHDV